MENKIDPTIYDKDIWLNELMEEVRSLYQDEHQVDCIDGVTPVETYGYEATHNQALNQVLELLKSKLSK